MRILHINDIAYVGSTLVEGLQQYGHDATLRPLQLRAKRRSTRVKLLALPLRLRQGTHEEDVLLAVNEDGARASFALDFTPSDILPDPAQDVLAQVIVQPIAALPETCPPSTSP